MSAPEDVAERGLFYGCVLIDFAMIRETDGILEKISKGSVGGAVATPAVPVPVPAPPQRAANTRGLQEEPSLGVWLSCGIFLEQPMKPG